MHACSPGLQPGETGGPSTNAFVFMHFQGDIACIPIIIASCNADMAPLLVIEHNLPNRRALGHMGA